MQSAMQATSTSTGSRLRILMVDDHPVVLAGVRAFLDEVSDLEVIATAATVEDAISRAQILRPDAFLLTVSASGSAPAESARRLRSQCPEIALVVLSLDADCAPAKEMQAAGASAVLEKGAGRDAVIAALQSLRTGDETGTRRLGARRDSVPPPSSGRSSLSRRELQVLTLIADGNTNKQIAEQLGISVRTVETHRERLMRKLAVQGTAALTKAAIALGLVNTEG